jgi:hypothetical protein
MVVATAATLLLAWVPTFVSLRAVAGGQVRACQQRRSSTVRPRNI